MIASVVSLMMVKLMITLVSVISATMVNDHIGKYGQRGDVQYDGQS